MHLLAKEKKEIWVAVLPLESQILKVKQKHNTENLIFIEIAQDI